MTIIHDPNAVAAFWSVARHSPLVMLYVGPDQIMPLASVLGAIAGIALMFWNRLVGLFVKVRTMFARQAEEPGKPPGK